MPRTPLDIAITPLGILLRNKRAGDNTSIRHRTELATELSLQLASSSFEDGGIIPDAHSAIGRGQNTSPALRWSTAPAETAQLLLIMEDVDIPLKEAGIHMVAIFSPLIASLREGALTTENVDGSSPSVADAWAMGVRAHCQVTACTITTSIFTPSTERSRRPAK
jgi:phosphatidylethanolamine-binding protein (PEBP) family uncharacterized protein